MTVSGISAGAAFSVILSYVFSSFIKGAGIFAGAPFPVGAMAFINPLKVFWLPAYIELVDSFVKDGLIDDTENFKSSLGVYVFHGLVDVVVPYKFSKMIASEYEHYGVKRVFRDIKNVPAGHCLPSDLDISLSDLLIRPCYGATLTLEAICGCSYSGVGTMFNHFYPDSYIPPLKKAPQTGDLFQFDQREFFPNGNAKAAGFWDFGFAYVPQRCSPGTGIVCKVHFAFHGCSQTLVPILLGNVPEMVKLAGYLENADANDIIVIFPQAKLNLPLFSIGCFDIYGYTSEFKPWFSSRNGTHPLAIKKMFERIAYGV